MHVPECAASHYHTGLVTNCGEGGRKCLSHAEGGHKKF